ncbi:hypothetical protein [Actinacidiphila oryziradicis]|uniref:Uncharacterized protein n=1 Tax=Actinacidiphila oryziradicis TaxID=2571141 RepID=A0A4U0R649_9ACTN|nr:hypothetical protein [Actinacidiphila oryziradicis]TJZ90409.1 hypothetical protein FCI23_55795 [Actinacidiphila oryziradicis]
MRFPLVKLQYPSRWAMGISALTACALATIALIAVAWWNADHPVHRYDDSAQGEVLVSKDGRTITIATTWGDCEVPPRLQAQENASDVRLTLRREDHAQPGHVCNNSGVKQIATTLDQPVGRRTVIDAMTGKHIPVFNERHLAAPGYLPKGYIYSDSLASSNVAGGKIPTPFEWPPTPTWTTAYQRDSFHGYLAITQATGNYVETTGTPATINGHQAFLQLSPSSVDRCSITWFDGTYTFNVYDSDPQQQPTRDEVLKIAENLH